MELYVDAGIPNRTDLSEQLINKFLSTNSFPQGFRIRFDISSLDTELNHTIQKLGLSEKAETFLFFEMNLPSENSRQPMTNLPQKKEVPQIIDVLSHLHPVNEEEVSSWLNNQTLRVVYQNGEPVAVAHISIAADGAEIIRIATHQNHLRQGFATTLIKNIKKELCDKKIKKLYLKVDESRSPAIKLYKSQGFEENKTLTESWHSKWF